MMDIKGSTSADADALHKEWDQTSCPICMDHPHNAVLLICSSHEKGCRSYICDTSYRHSNCLDRFRKPKTNRDDLFDNSDSQRLHQRSHDNNLTIGNHVGSQRMQSNLAAANDGGNLEENNDRISADLFDALEENNNNNALEPDRYFEAQREERILPEESGQGSSNTSESNSLKCPLCRGTVMGWMIVKEVRQYLDQKPRSCSRESCSFSGNYRELRRHARRVHPTTRPADVDPSRQHAWHCLEHQREYGDILSAIRSAMPGAIVLGDYVIDSRDAHEQESAGSGEGGGPWWSTFFLFHMISSPIGSFDQPRVSRAWRAHRRSSGHRSLWGENLLGLHDDDDDDDSGNPDNDDIPEIPRRRRRLMRSRPDGEQP